MKGQQHQPTQKQIDAQGEWDMISQSFLGSGVATDKDFEMGADVVAATYGLGWSWRWPDETVIVWKDGDNHAYFANGWHKAEVQ